MGMEIKDARIVNVISETKGGLWGFGLELDLYDGTRYFTPYSNATHEDLCTFFDVVGVRLGDPLKNTLIRVLVDEYDKVILIGNRTYNKWVDLKWFIVRYLNPGVEDLILEHVKLTNEKERTQKKMKDLNKVIARPYRMTEIRKRFDKLDLVEIDTYLDQGEYFLSKETDEDCRQYIFNTIAREIAEIAYIEPPEYTPEKAKHFRDTMNKHLLLALQYNEY